MATLTYYYRKILVIHVKHENIRADLNRTKKCMKDNANGLDINFEWTKTELQSLHHTIQ